MRYPKYPEYRGSGLEWLGKVPSHWVTWKATHGFSSIGSGTTPKSENAAYYGGDIPWITTSELRENTVGQTKQRLTYEALEDYSALKLYPAGSLAIAMYGATIGRLGILGIDATVNQACCVFSEPEQFHTKFFFYWLWMARPYLLSQSVGGGQPNLSQDDLKQLRAPAPCIDEQKLIADFLDHKTSQLDTLIAKKQQLIDKLNEKRISLITQAVTKGIDASAPMKDSEVEWLGSVPAHWIVAGLTKFVDSRVDYRGKTPEKVKNGVFLVTAKNIKNGVVDYELSQEYVREEDYDSIMSRGLPEAGDVLFTTEAPLGEVANVDRTDIALAQRVIKFRGKENIINNYFLKYWMMSIPFQQHLQSMATGSTALGIKASKLYALRIVVPKYHEQSQIVDFIDREAEKLDRMAIKIRAVMDNLTEYRESIITAAVTGKIDTRNINLEHSDR